MALEKEMRAYQARLPELTADEGKFALIYGDEIVDILGTYEDAIKEGYGRFQLSPFLVKQINSIEQVQFVTRTLICHTSHAK